MMGNTQAKTAPTAAAAFFQQRRAEFNANAANRALAAMRKGAQLRLQYRDGRPSWSLGGKSVSADVAAILIVTRSSYRPTPRCFPTCRAKPGG